MSDKSKAQTRNTSPLFQEGRLGLSLARAVAPIADPIKKIALGVFLIGVASSAASSAEQAEETEKTLLSIEVFTTSKDPAKASQIDGVVIYEVDALDQMGASLTKNLPSDADTAKEETLRRIARLGDELRWTVEHAVEGVTLAEFYALREFPAIVFDHGKSVVYGVTDVDLALTVYQTNLDD